MKPAKLGCINACGIASLFDKEGEYIGNCLDTPNAIARAIIENSDIEIIKAKYPGWAEVVTTAAEYDDRVMMLKKFG